MQKINNLELIQGGDFLDGVCIGLMGGAGISGALTVASNLGWIAAIPGVGQVTIALSAAMAVTCAINMAIDN